MSLRSITLSVLCVPFVCSVVHIVRRVDLIPCATVADDIPGRPGTDERQSYQSGHALYALLAAVTEADPEVAILVRGLGENLTLAPVRPPATFYDAPKAADRPGTPPG